MKITPLLTAETIAKRIDEMAKEIAEKFSGKELLIVPLMRGSFIFAADLGRALNKYDAVLEFDFLGLSSYKDGTETTGEVVVTADTTIAIKGKHVLVIDDILESGLSLTCAIGMMHERLAATVTTAVLLEKPGKREVNIDADYVGFEIEDKFVVGYGLDYANKYRELPYVGVYDG